jgi:hypothetical protein
MAKGDASLLHTHVLEDVSGLSDAQRLARGLPVRRVWNPFGREKLLEGDWLKTGARSVGACAVCG